MNVYILIFLWNRLQFCVLLNCVLVKYEPLCPYLDVRTTHMFTDLCCCLIATNGACYSVKWSWPWVLTFTDSSQPSLITSSPRYCIADNQSVISSVTISEKLHSNPNCVDIQYTPEQSKTSLESTESSWFLAISTQLICYRDGDCALAVALSLAQCSLHSVGEPGSLCFYIP